MLRSIYRNDSGREGWRVNKEKSRRRVSEARRRVRARSPRKSPLLFYVPPSKTCPFLISGTAGNCIFASTRCRRVIFFPPEDFVYVFIIIILHVAGVNRIYIHSDPASNILLLLVYNWRFLLKSAAYRVFYHDRFLIQCIIMLLQYWLIFVNFILIVRKPWKIELFEHSVYTVYVNIPYNGTIAVILVLLLLLTFFTKPILYNIGRYLLYTTFMV